MKVETFNEDAAIYHLEKSSDKMYIIMQGTAKEFIPKTISEVEKEYRENPNYVTPMIPKIKILNEVGKPQDVKKSPSLKPQRTGEKKSSLIGVVESVTEDSNSAVSRESLGSHSARKKRTFQIPKNIKSIIFEKKDSLGIPSSGYDSGGLTPRSNSPRDGAFPWGTPRDISPGSSTARTHRKSNYANQKRETEENNSTEMQDKVVDEEIPEEFWRYPDVYLMGRIVKVKLNRLLQMGDCIGMDILEGKTIQKTAVLTMRDCVVVSLSRDDFLRVLRQRRMQHKGKIDFFEKVFAEKSDLGHVAAFSMFWEAKELRKNEVIFKQDEASKFVYLLCEGEVILSRTLTDIKDAAKVFHDEVQVQAKKKNGVTESIQYVFKVGIVTKEHIFGEKDFFEEAPRAFTATITSVYAKFYKLSIEDYREIRQSYADVVNEMLKKSVYQSSWKQERLDEFYELNNLERTPLHQYENYLEQKLRAFGSVPKYSEKFLYLKKPRIKPVDKAKLEPLLEYLKFVIPKAGQNVPDYLEYLADEIRNQNLAQNILQGLGPNDQQIQEFVNENDEWFPFVKGRVTSKRSSAEREYPASQEQSPKTAKRVLENNIEPDASIYRKKLVGSISSIDTSMFNATKPQALAPLGESLKLSKPQREFSNTTPAQKTLSNESQPTKEDMIPIKNGLKIPKLILENNNNHKLDPLPMLSMSARNTPNMLKLAKERIQFAARHDYANSPHGLSTTTSRKARFCTTDRLKEDSILTMLTKPQTPAVNSPFVYKASPKFTPGPFFSLSNSPVDMDRKTPAFEEAEEVLPAVMPKTHKRSQSDIENHAPLSVVNNGDKSQKDNMVVWPIMHKRNLSGNVLGLSKLRSVPGCESIIKKRQPMSARGESVDLLTRVHFKSPRERSSPLKC